MAATYPLEVIQASRWLKDNKGLKDDALKAAARQAGLGRKREVARRDPSVLDMMSDKLDWTQKLGDAMLAQQTDVMDGSPASARQGRREQQAAVDQAAEGFEEIRRQQAGHRH